MHDGSMLPTSYEATMTNLEQGDFVVILPTMDEDGPMVLRAVWPHATQGSHQAIYAIDPVERASVAISAAVQVRSQHGYVLPHVEDYPEPRDV